AGAVLILPADLPLVEPSDVSALIQMGKNKHTVVIATDEHRDGTNAMLVRPPGIIRYSYGPGSFQRHLADAKAQDATVRVYESARLALDIDMPDDLARYKQ